MAEPVLIRRKLPPVWVTAPDPTRVVPDAPAMVEVCDAWLDATNSGIAVPVTASGK